MIIQFNSKVKNCKDKLLLLGELVNDQQLVLFQHTYQGIEESEEMLVAYVQRFAVKHLELVQRIHKTLNSTQYICSAHGKARTIGLVLLVNNMVLAEGYDSQLIGWLLAPLHIIMHFVMKPQHQTL